MRPASRLTKNDMEENAKPVESQTTDRKKSAGHEESGRKIVFSRVFASSTSPQRQASASSFEAESGMAEPTGLEPATSAVTGQRSNQLS